MTVMKVSDFDFELPQELIAQVPAEPRDSSRLLHITDKLFDHGIKDLPDLLNPGDILVFNNTKVIPSRLTGRRGEATVEVTLHKQQNSATWWAFAKGAKRLNSGDKIIFADDFICTISEKRDGGEVLLVFEGGMEELMAGLNQYGYMPLPPYIKRKKGGLPQDRYNYQTLYAERDGAVAAPTAGLHFTEELMAALDQRGVQKAYVTLHVGAGTFLPIKVADTDDHVMHAEWGELDAATARVINQARATGGKVISVGSTSLRLLETAADEKGILQAFSGETAIFITPGYKFKITDKMVTNFHLPKSTLFMLIAALGGRERIKAAYAHAISERYRFFSYGDASLIEKSI
jgi:S-adenosylmethionine:tRNA ribosyltransferase-isomerase